jgi:hypothetical protein
MTFSKGCFTRSTEVSEMDVAQERGRWGEQPQRDRSGRILGLDDLIVQQVTEVLNGRFRVQPSPT